MRRRKNEEGAVSSLLAAPTTMDANYLDRDGGEQAGGDDAERQEEHASKAIEDLFKGCERHGLNPLFY